MVVSIVSWITGRFAFVFAMPRGNREGHRVAASPAYGRPRAVVRSTLRCIGHSGCLQRYRSISISVSAPLWLVMAASLCLPGATLTCEESPPAAEDGIWSTIGSESWSFTKDTGSDLGGFITAPMRFDAKDWAIFGGVVAGMATIGITSDDSAWANAQEDRSTRSNAVARWANHGGTVYSLTVLGAFGTYSLFDEAAPNPARRVLRDGLEATIIASGVITPVIKFIAGRERPGSAGNDVDTWNPFSGDASFPSGHTTQAFAIASVVTANYRDEWWVGPIAYTAAASVGWARMNDDQHYLSDVLFGAAIGTAVGWYVVERENDRRSTEVTFMPWVVRDGFGAEMVIRF